MLEGELVEGIGTRWPSILKYWTFERIKAQEIRLGGLSDVEPSEGRMLCPLTRRPDTSAPDAET